MKRILWTKPRLPTVGGAPRWAPGVSITSVSDGLMVVHERTGRTCHLNASAALIVTALVRGATDSELAIDIAELFGIPETSAASDIADLLTQLQQRKLVSR